MNQAVHPLTTIEQNAPAASARIVSTNIDAANAGKQLVEMFADETEYVELVGQDAQRLKNIPPEVAAQAQQTPQASVLVPWSKANIFGRYSFTINPDSQLHLDVVQQREQWLKFFNFLANEPTCNRTELTKEGMKLFNYDPARFTQQPPPHTPEPPALGKVAPL